MYNVFLVEDEIVVREGVRNSIDWSATDFSLIGEAQDGEMALSMMNDLKPDILITDIKMPFMDGLELSRLVKKSMPWIKVVILSGYDAFDFAKEAISIGVEEYLIKPVDAKELLQTLNKVKERIEEENRRKADTEALKLELESSANMKRHKMFAELSRGGADIPALLEYAAAADIKIIAKKYMVIIAETELQDYDYQEYMKAFSYIIDALKREDSFFFSVDFNRIVIIVKGEADAVIEETAYEIANAVKHGAERQTQCVLRIAIGTVVDRLSLVHISFSEADKVMKYMKALGTRKILSAREKYAEKPLDEKWLSNLASTDRMKYADKSEIPEMMLDYLKSVPNEECSLLISYHVLVEVLIFASKIISASGGDPNEIIPECKNPYMAIAEVETRSQLAAVVQGILERTFDFRDSYDGLRYNAVIKKAREYIDQNYSNPNISLKMLAEAVSLSPNHFSTVFSQETGETFIAYLTKVRVQKAKEMLANTNLRSTDIAFNIGYSESHYFSYIFKKSTGVTPREFRAASKL